MSAASVANRRRLVDPEDQFSRDSPSAVCLGEPAPGSVPVEWTPTRSTGALATVESPEAGHRRASRPCMAGPAGSDPSTICSPFVVPRAGLGSRGNTGFRPPDLDVFKCCTMQAENRPQESNRTEEAINSLPQRSYVPQRRVLQRSSRPSAEKMVKVQHDNKDSSVPHPELRLPPKGEQASCAGEGKWGDANIHRPGWCDLQEALV